MKCYLLTVLILVLGCSCSPQSSPTADAAVSGWGPPVSGLRCRVKTCALAPDGNPGYPARISIGLQIQNVSQARKDVRILAPISGEPCVALMMEAGKKWQTIGNAVIAPKSKRAVLDVKPGEVLMTDFSEGLTKAEADSLQQGCPLKCILIAFGKGPCDPASVQTAVFSISNINGTPDKTLDNKSQ